MNEAQNYLNSHEGYFYVWETRCEVLSVSAGATICYREYLHEILKHLEIQGIPKLGTLLLAIVATNINGKEAIDNIEAGYKREKHSVDPGFGFLYTLAALPASYRQGSRRLQLFQTIFKKSHNLIGAARAKEIIRQFDFVLDKGIPIAAHPQQAQFLFNKHLQPFGILMSRYPDVESIINAMADLPMLDEQLLDFEQSLPADEPSRAKDYIEKLEQNADTFYVGSLVRRIWSGLSIPFHSAHPTVQPIGGVSGLSNKGTFDKLLISEFAHDDLLFLSRLANDEALYINRETPPETNKLKRILLIDSSLQTWGTPRTLLYAIALAIAYHPKTDIECVAYAVGESHTNVLFDTVHHLIDSLATLDTSLNAASGCLTFFKEALPKEQHEIFLLTSPDGLQQAPMQRVLSDFQTEFSYCITASEHAAIQVYKKSGKGIKAIQSLKLPLETLWKAPPERRSAARKIAATPISLPSQYPILFPEPNVVKKAMTTSDGHTFIVSDEHALLRKAKISSDWRAKGYVYIYEKIPSNCQYEMGKTSYGDYLFLYYETGAKLLHIRNLTKGVAASVLFDKRRVSSRFPEFLFWHDHFFLLDNNGYFRFLFYSNATDDNYIIDTEYKEVTPGMRIMDAYIARQAALTAMPGIGGISSSLLKTIKSVHINDNSNLVINRHELIISDNKKIRFTASKNTANIMSQMTARNQFVFHDGSTVSLNRNGMLILVSSNKTIPTLYIPSVLDMDIGIASEDCYFGRDYFQPEDHADDKVFQLFYKFLSHIAQHATNN